MVAATAGTVTRKHIALTGGQVLIIGKEDGKWQVALWRKRRETEHCLDIPQQLWDQACRTWLPAKQKREEWTRFAYSAPAFLPAANTALSFSYPKVDIGEFQDYVRATSWGKDVLG